MSSRENLVTFWLRVYNKIYVQNREHADRKQRIHNNYVTETYTIVCIKLDDYALLVRRAPVYG